MAASHDGSFVVCPCDDALRVVELRSGKEVLVVQSEEDEFTAFALHPSRLELVSASRSRQLRHWTLGSPQELVCTCVRVWKAHKLAVADLAYEPTGTLVASGGADGAVMVFDVAKGFCTHVFRGSSVVHRVLFHPDPGRLLLFSTAADHVVRLWDLRSRACVAELAAHAGVPASLAVSPDGRTLLSGGRDQIGEV